MAASSAFIESLNIKVECKICFGRLDDPRHLPCAHSFCKRCLDRLLRFNQDGSASVSCPNRCENGIVRIGVDETTRVLPRNYELLGVLELLETTTEPQ